MKILVTGGAGYIGSSVAAALLKAGHEVTVYDSLVKGHKTAVPANATFIQGDILDRVLLNSVLSSIDFDAVFHFAALIEAGESMYNPGKFFHNNVNGSINLIETITAHDIPRFVFSSTAGLYAGKKTTPLREHDPINPANVYGHTKWMVEQVLNWYSQIKGLKYAALRYFNAAGATQKRGEDHRPESHLIPLIIRVALGQKEKIDIYGDDYPTRDGTCIRDYIHIKDLVSAHLLALEGMVSRNKMIYNLGNGEGYSVKEVIETARKVTGCSIPSQVNPRRDGDAAILVADSTLIRKELGWTPQIPSLYDIIADAWKWHQAHPNGYEE